jgi:CubicO group peptidase (beta-lactamase class C family)
VGILQLAEAGRLSLDDTVASHLEDYPNQAVAAAVTIRQLLNHTSGLGEIFDDAFETRKASLKTLRILPLRGTSAGGGYSTARDLLRFAEALRAGRLIPAAAVQAATSPQNTKGWYGYGFMVSGEDEQRQYGHEGGAPGANAALIVLPSQGYVVIGLSNVDPDAMENVVSFVGNRLPL